ncbi:SprB repeat-containing protein [Ekhidna sp.]|uniref:SprB repeat-containing protein n=1 Tax=Ekhidna sp. TaxID=2608089 RepID=UPI003CCC28A5
MSSTIQKLVLIVLLSSIISCTSDQIGPKVDCTIDPVQVEINAVADATCGSSDGSFSLNVSGGSNPYTFSTEFETNANGNFTQLAAGSYLVVVTDSTGCSSEIEVSIKNEEGVNLDDVRVSNTSCGTSKGSIEVEASGGIEPYSYSINGGASQSSSIFSDLSNGSYNVAVMDATGCETSESVNILTGVSYENSIKAIIETNCAISGCHNGSVSPDLRTFSTIQSSASRIKARTGNGSMPRGRTLTQTQIDLIACWVDDGALDN